MKSVPSDDFSNEPTTLAHAMGTSGRLCFVYRPQQGINARSGKGSGLTSRAGAIQRPDKEKTLAHTATRSIQNKMKDVIENLSREFSKEDVTPMEPLAYIESRDSESRALVMWNPSLKKVRRPSMLLLRCRQTCQLGRILYDEARSAL